MGPGASGSPLIYPADTVLLETRMRYGEISYRREDVLKRGEERWKPPEELENYLRENHQSKPEVKVRFYTDKYGVVQSTVTERKLGGWTRLENPLCYCFVWLKNRLCPFPPRLQNCFIACFMGLAHCFGLLCWYIARLLRR